MVAHHSDSLISVNSETLHQLRSRLLCNSWVKTINDIRRERLLQLRDELKLTFAEMSVKLGRSRRDGTLNQIATRQKESKTGTVRSMGDAQARAIEVAFDKEVGWMDRDPDFDLIVRTRDGSFVVETKLAEPRASYDVEVAWPFPRVDPGRVKCLPAKSVQVLEDMLLTALETAERLSSQRAA